MTSALSGSSQTPAGASNSNNTNNTNNTTSSAAPTTTPGPVQARSSVKSWANITKTATPPSSAGASGPGQNAEKLAASQVNGAMAQNSSQPSANGAANGTSDHSRKPSVVINASGASGSYPNGGPVGQNGSRPAISFGSMNTAAGDHAAASAHSQNSLQRPPQDPRVTSPTHSPSPIPQPAASGGRPPSSLPNQNNGGLAFGSLPADTEMMRGHQISQSNLPAHERRTSSHSMQSELSNQGMRPQFPAQGRGAGRGFPPQPAYMSSPGQQFRPMANQPPRHFQPQGAPPGSPYNRQARASPAQVHALPHMPPQHQQHGMFYPQQAGYGQLHPQQQQMYGGMEYNPYAGYYGPPYYQPGQPPQSPRPGNYPNPYQSSTPSMQPPFHPPSTPGMQRTPSQASERPSSSLGHPQTPSQSVPVPSGTPVPNPTGTPSQSSSFVRPVKKSNPVKITDPNGNTVNFTKPSPTPPSAAPSQGPVIVSTPNAPTPPPRSVSNNHNRAESKSTKSAEETRSDFAERVKSMAAKTSKATDDDSGATSKTDEAAAAAVIKEATADAEKAAAKAADDKKAEEDAEAAKKTQEADAEAEKKRKQQEEDERIEREIAEMEAREKEEEERERAYQEKKNKEKAEKAAKEAEYKKNIDEELKRQEREAEAREEAREREREAESKKEDGPDDEAKAMFASLKKNTQFGPSASATPSGTETPSSDKDNEESSTETATAQPARVGALKPKPAHLKLETNKSVERAEPTPGMQALKSARFLEVKEEPSYPEGFKSPNPALNDAGARKGRAYDKNFLLQFQSVFKEKPSVDWDQKVKETLGPSDEPGSARTPSGRGPSGMGPRQASRGNQQNMGAFGGAMGSFGGGPVRNIPAGTTSEQRFMASQMGVAPGGGRPGAARAPSNLGMGQAAGMSRTNSLQMMGNIGGPGSPRQPSSRGGKGGSRRDDRQQSKRQEQDMAAKMPLTAHMEIAPLEKSQTGWKPMSLGQAPAAAGPDPSGLMAPDMVQRKVKAALNKMTPEKFDKISDQILEIAAQSKHETDGRTLRQVIQLTFEKACDEAHWAGMYAKFCQKMLTTMSTEIRDETIKDKAGNPVVGGALFRKYLLNRCQEEFERGWQANLPDKPEGGESQEAALLSDEYYVAAAAKRRGLGLIQFIGQLYKLRMLTLRIMHECVMRLLNFEGDPDEAAVENLTTLLRAVGATMDEEEQGKALMEGYFKRIDEVIMKSEKLPSRPKFMIMDLTDLRKAGWKGKDDAKGPKTIQQIHEEAQAAEAKKEAERAKSGRGGPGGGRMPTGRGDARNFSGGNMPPPVDYSRTTVGMDDLRRLQNRGQNRSTGGSLGPGGGLGPSTLGPRTGSRRGAGLGPGSAGTSRTNTPPVGDKKEEPATAQNAFSALAALDPSGEPEEQAEAASPPAARNRSKSPLAAEKDESSAA